MIPEEENPQEAKSVRPGQPARYAQADPGRYFMHSPQCWFSHGTPRLYFAGPTDKFMKGYVEFWEMVWQEKVDKIVMLTNFMEESVSPEFVNLNYLIIWLS